MLPLLFPSRRQLFEKRADLSTASVNCKYVVCILTNMACLHFTSLLLHNLEQISINIFLNRIIRKGRGLANSQIITFV